jgi:hypothetical protein
MNDATFTIPIGWALTGFLSLCGIVGALGKLIYSLLMYRIQALEKDVTRLSGGCGAHGCFWKTIQHRDK